MMSPGLSLVPAWLAGVGLSLFYFGGLWLTVRRLPTARWPAALLVGSFLGRTAVVLVGLYFAMGGRWERALAWLVGFVMARFLLISWLPSARAPEIPRGNETV